MLKCHSVQHLDLIMSQILKVYQKDSAFNCYYSMAKYMEGIPNQNPDLSQRDNTEWTEKHHTFMDSYDWLVDIDAGSHDELDYAHFSARQIKLLFDQTGVPYEMRFSGCGFHFVIPNSFFLSLNLTLNPHLERNYYQFLLRINKILHRDYSEMVDWNTSDSRRLCKVPYSLALYKDRQYVCMPFLSDKEFDEFTLDHAEPSNYFSVRQRGTHLFNGIKGAGSKDFLDRIGLEVVE